MRGAFSCWTVLVSFRCDDDDDGGGGGPWRGGGVLFLVFRLHTTWTI